MLITTRSGKVVGLAGPDNLEIDSTADPHLYKTGLHNKVHLIQPFSLCVLNTDTSY